MTWHHVSEAVTLLGDNRVLLIMSVLFVGYLHRQKQYAIIKSWLRTLIYCTCTIAICKAIGYVFIGRSIGMVFVSISSHVALSSFCYPSILLILITTDKNIIINCYRILIIATVIGFIIIVALSRLILKQHTIWEIIAGLLLGSTSVVVFMRSSKDDTVGLYFYQTALATIIIGRIIISCQSMPLEDIVQQGALYLVGNVINL